MKLDKWLHIYSDKSGVKFAVDEVADVRENVRGEWIIIKDQEWSGGEYVKCSNCDYGYAKGS